MLARFSDFDGFPTFGRRGLSRGFSFDELRREMDRMLFDFSRAEPQERQSYPRLTFEDRGEALFLRAEVPGLSQEELGLTVTATTVVLTGKRKVRAPEGYATHRNERQGFEFSRSFELGTKIDPEKVQASLEHGVLTVTLPKAPEAQPKKITVKAS